MTEYKLDAADWETYGGPEWITFTKEMLLDAPFDQLHAWEREMGVSAVMLLGREIPAYSALGTKAMLWIGRQVAGETVPGWDAFNIKTTRVTAKLDTGEGDAVPPQETDSSTESSESTPASQAG